MPIFMTAENDDFFDFPGTQKFSVLDFSKQVKPCANM